MKDLPSQTITLNIDPGICGFPCQIQAWKKDGRAAGLAITGSDCKMVRRLSELLQEVSLKALFLPLTKNPVFLSAEKARCHNACPVPSAVVKALEVALDLAVQKDVAFRFDGR